MREQLLHILEDVQPGVDYESQTGLIDGGVLDSFDLIMVVTDIKSTFDVDITVEDLQSKNFNSVDAMLALIERLQNE